MFIDFINYINYYATDSAMIKIFDFESLKLKF